MIKSELVSKLTEQNPHLYQRDIEKAVDAILSTIGVALAQNKRVELRGFGTFTVKKREARTGRNPRTGEAVSISEKLVPVFRTSKEMRHRLNPASQRRIKKRSGAGGTNVRALVEIPTTNLQALPGSDQNKAARPGLDYLKQTYS